MKVAIKKCFRLCWEALPKSFRYKMRSITHILSDDWLRLYQLDYMHTDKFADVDLALINEKFAAVDEKSRQEIKIFIDRCQDINWLFNLPFEREYFLINRDFADSKNLTCLGVSRELKRARRKYKVQSGIESLVFHNGVLLLPKAMHEYIKGKDFIDAGAFVGDSALPLFNYEPSKIYAFDPSAKNAENFDKNLRKNKITEDRWEIIVAALGKERGSVEICDTGSDDQRLDIKGDVLVDVVAIDDFVAERKLNVALIKADVEGMGLKLVQGAIKTICDQRPVLALSAYHTPVELFGQYDFLREHLKDYIFEFTCLPPGTGHELTMLAYPAN